MRLGGVWTDESGHTYQGPLPPMEKPPALGPLGLQMWVPDPQQTSMGGWEVSSERGEFIDCRHDDGTSLMEQWILDPRVLTYLEYLQLPVRELAP